MTDDDDYRALAERFEQLTETMRGTETVVSSFSQSLDGVRAQMLYTDKEITSLSKSFGTGMRNAFDDVVFDGKKLSEALRDVGRSMVDAAYNTAMKPIQNSLGGLVAGGLNSLASGLLPFAQGGSFVQGKVTPFASGGIVSSPTTFPMRGGRGLMGEAGPEAIMPLTRGADGRLGVQTSGGGRAVSVTMNINTPDAGSFRRSKAQIAAEMNRMLAQGQRNR